MALEAGQSVMEYRVEQTLGGGGFGITYLARDVNLNLPVALKEYLPAELAHRQPDGTVATLSDDTAEQFKWGLERFLDEARALATFRHPNIARVLRFFPAHGTAYIVMEYESGRPLKTWLPGRMPIDQRTLMGIVLPLLDGLEMIHNAGFLHRDVKPDNIYMRADGSPVLIDFGSARNLGANRDLTTIVSPGFAPFEQYHSRGHQGPWSDLYSLAAVMYWMVSGHKPIESAARLKNDSMVPALQCGRADLVGEAVLRAIDWALDPDETRRPQSVAEFRARIAPDAGYATTRLAATARVAPPPPAFADSMSASRGPISQGTPSAPSILRSGPTGEPPRGNLICSVLFLDIVGYSKTSVNEQYEIKSAFNQLLAGKLAHIPESTRITLDTGDGAAISFMGDPEEVLHTAVDVRRSLSALDSMKVRMGLHMGPVRILNDLNGRVNVIGDGINAAQRVMSFASDNGLLVSRAFYDVVSCLSEGAEKAFRHIGSQPDKHGRLHELYEVVQSESVDGIGNHTLRIDDDPAAAAPVPAAQPLASASPAAAAESISAVPAQIDPEEYARIARELSRHMGPLAPVLMRKARGRAANAVELRELLSRSIPDPALREAFRTGQGGEGDSSRLSDSGRSRSGGTPASGFAASTLSVPGSMPRSVPGSMPGSMSGSRSGSVSQVPSSASFAPSTSSASHSTSQSAATVKPWLSAEAITRLEKLLAQTVGPVARVLVKNESRKAASFEALCDALATHIDDAAARARFLKDARSSG